MRVWLVTNEMSGSNDRERLECLHRQFADAGAEIAFRTRFPIEASPEPAVLDAADIDIVAVFAGDGTQNAVITGLAGWCGAVLALPGGTMNLLYHRLFGEQDYAAVIRRAAAGELLRRRPRTIVCAAGTAYAGLLAGPATAWYDVREALRKHDLAGMAERAGEALQESFQGDYVRCAVPELGRGDGYPLLALNPHDGGIEVAAYHAESAVEVLEQAAAILRRAFREGPHDWLGEADRVRLASVDGDPFDILLDGEPAEARPQEDFSLVPAQVDLLASIAHD